MKKILLLATLVLGMVSCMKDQSLDANLAGDGNFVLSVALPNEATRAAGNDSALGAVDNGILNEYDVRYTLEVYDVNDQLAKRDQHTVNSDKTSFELRLIPGRHYRFVVWADFVKAGVDPYYNVANLREVSLTGTHNAMNESRDAYTAVFNTAEEGDKEKFSSASSIKMELTRPFAKLRVVTNDIKEIYSTLQSATVKYTTPIYSTFNALYEEAGNPEPNVSKTVDFTSDDYKYTDEQPKTDGKQTLFADYIFGTENGTVQFTLDVKDYVEGSGVVTALPQVAFNTAIPVERNYLTTIYGPVLTDFNKVTVDIDNVFANAGNIEDAPYYQVAVTNGVELIKALMQGQEIIVLNDITVTAADLAAATRAGEAINPVLNLNGFTITIENENTGALVNLNNGALTVQGDGKIESTNGALVEGTTVVTEGADVEAEVAVDENGQSAVKTGVDALAYVLEKGGEFTFTENLAISEVLLASTTNPVVINGADFTLTSAATRAIRATVANANIVVNDLNIDVTTERVYPNDIRGISIDDVTGVELTLNNCSVIFSHPTGNDWAYAVNVTGGSNHKVTVNGGTYNGANVINVRGEKQTVIVKNATLTSLYPNNDVYYGACIYVVQNENSSVYAEGNTFNGDNALAFNIGYTPIEEKNNTNNAKRVSAKVNGAYYYNIAEAIAAAEDGATITVLQNHDCNVGATVAAGKTITLDLNGKTITGTDKNAAGNFYLIDNRGTLTISDSSEAKTGAIKLSAETERYWNSSSVVVANNPGGKLVVENGTIEHLGGTDMAYGIDNLTNGKGTYAETVINGGTIKSTYRAVRMFLNGIEAQNLLTVNGGIIEGANKSIWMQDPSAKANTGKLVVNEGATLNGDVYLFVTAGSTEWPVEVSIAASAVNGEVLTGNVPAGYEVVENNGVWTVVAYTEVSTADELVAALKAEKNVLFKNDITVAATNGGYNKAGILQNKCQTINGNGYALTVTGAGATWDCAIYTNGGVIKNLTVKGAMRGIFTAGTSADLYIENVKFENVIYTFNSDGGNNNYGVYVSNSTLNGWTSHSDVHKEVVYTNCSFGEGSGYKFCRPYGPTTFVGCNFCEGYKIDARGKVNFANCTLNGVALTNENLNTLVEKTTNTQFTDAEGNLLVSTADELVAALEANKSVAFANDIKIEPASMSNAYGATGINIKNGQTINGNGYTLNIKGAGGTWDSGINTTGGVIKNLTVTGSFRGIFINHTSEHSEKVVLENVTIGGNGTVYTISCDQGLYQGIEATNCTFNGWTSFAKTAGEAKFVNCYFGEGSTYKYCRPYSNTEFVGCTFCPGYAVDTTRATVTFTDCTWEE